MLSSSTKDSPDKSSHPKTRLELNEVLENARRVPPPSSEGDVSSGSQLSPQTIYKRTTTDAASRTAKKPKRLAESSTEALKQETQPQRDVLPKKQSVKTVESPSKSQTLRMKKASSQTAGNYNTKQTMPKQTKRKRPLSTEVSLSSTSPANLQQQAGKTLRGKGTSLRHSWHGMPSSLKPGQGQQRQQKGKMACKGNQTQSHSIA